MLPLPAATIFAFLAFVLIAAGQADEEWISGGFENNNWSALPPSERAAAIPERLAKVCPSCVELGALGDTFTRRFNLGLHIMTVEGSYYFNNTGKNSYRECQYPLVSTRIRGQGSIEDLNHRFARSAARNFFEASMYAPSSSVPCPVVQNDFIDNFNAAINQGQSWAVGLSPINWAVFASTQGMLVFAAIVMVRGVLEEAELAMASVLP